MKDRVKQPVLNLLADALENEGIPVIRTREPGGIEIAEQIRKVILDRANINMDPRTEHYCMPRQEGSI